MRISVTDLDSYLYWKSSEDVALETLLSRLRRETEPTPAMMAGRAFHKALETAAEGSLESVEVDGFKFRFLLDCELALSPIRELKGDMIVPTSAGNVTLVGVVDAMHGLTVRDYKLTERFDAERYIDSYQWRSYLTIFRANRFIYDVFVCREELDTRIIYDYHQLPIYAYDGIERDVAEEVDGLARIIAQYLPERMAA